MKRFLLCISLVFLLTSVRAQNNDEVVSSSDELQYESSVGVSQSLHHLQKAAKGDIEYSSFFFEGLTVFQRNNSTRLGLNFSYVPYRMGGYASGALNYSHYMLTGGLVVRPLAGIVRTDWQLFGGVAYAQGLEQFFANPVGFEIGARLGANYNANGGRFAWWSFSLSRVYVDHRAYYTIGLSLNLAALFGAWIII